MSKERKRGFKKALMIVLCMVICTVMMLPATFAAVPVTGKISATNIKEDGVTVNAYQIVKGVYKDGKLTGYELVDGVTIADTDDFIPTAAEITAIANAIEEGTLVLTPVPMTDAGNGTDGDFIYSPAAAVSAGEYIVLVTGSDATVYNPGVVSVKVTDADTGAADDGLVNFAGKYGDTAYMKSSLSDISKTVVNSGETNDNGDTVAYGDTVEFKLDKMTVPSYSDDYTDLVYQISDVLEAGAFEGINDLTVTVGGTEVTASATTFTLTGGTANDTSFTVAFADAFIRAHGGEAVEVTYSSTISDTAGINFDENTNKVTLTYSNDPSDPDSAKIITRNTYHYTFGIDAAIDGTNGEEGYEINKVSKNSTEYEAATGVSGLDTQKNKKALVGAEFTLYSDAEMTTVIGTSTSDANGHITFKGLDEGTYYMKETNAPDGYSLSSQDYKLVISAELNDDGSLASYSIVTYDITTTESQIGSATYTSEHTIETNGDVTNTITPDVDTLLRY